MMRSWFFKIFSGIIAYTYDELNNIITKDGRIYEYDTTRPHAVTALKEGEDTIYTYEYDANGNMTRTTGFSKIDIQARGNGVKVEAESASRVSYDRGYYPEGCFDGIDVIAGQEGLYWSGALRFAPPADAEPMTRIISYGQDNRVESINDNGNISYYYYDAAGQRIKKIENGITTLYFFANYEEEYEGGITRDIIRYYFANGQMVAQRREDGVFYYHTDHLGSAVRLTNQQGKPVRSVAYDPYGAIIFYSGSDDYRYKFTGKELDASGLYYFGARFYDPMLGRFIQADTVLDGLNRYTYCRNNPLKYVDPSGNFIFSAIGGLIGAVVGGAADTIYQLSQIAGGNQESYVLSFSVLLLVYQFVRHSIIISCFWADLSINHISFSLSRSIPGHHRKDNNLSGAV
jgi:RHS repeat-associated protein